MADLPSNSRSKGDTGDDTDSTPRWVKVFGTIAVVLVLLFVVLHLTGRGLGGHTPTMEHTVPRP
jgi:ABC-type transporter Mla subunit MlaD